MMLHRVSSMLKLPPPITDVYVDGVSIDSRTLQQHNLFIAINGDNFDGHHYLEAAKAKGAAAALVDVPSENPVLPELVAGDTRKAMGLLAKAWLKDSTAKRVAITGSVGKTTVKEMVAAVLRNHSQSDDSVIATLGNLNNDLGVPLTVFRVTSETQYGVFELGANHSGEIAYTADIVKPHVALINNVAGVHLEGFGSIDGVAQAKSEIYQYLTQTDTAIINADDAYAAQWLEQVKQRNSKVKTYSLDSVDADVYATDIELSNAGVTFMLNAPAQEITTAVTLSILGEHSCRNALAAASICLALEIPTETIVSGLAHVGDVKGRLNIKSHETGATLIDDTYNANGKSVKAGIDVVAQLSSNKLNAESIVVLGFLGELGLSESEICEDIAAHASAKNISQLWVVGEQAALYEAGISSAVQFRKFASVADATDALFAQMNRAKDKLTVLVKGSRSARMEQVFDLLQGCSLSAAKGSELAGNDVSSLNKEVF